MEIGIGLDAGLNLSWEDQAELCQEAARLGYTSVWTPEGTGHDSFHVCVHRWGATEQVVADGLMTGIAVSPVALRTPVAMAMAGATASDLTRGHFIMGIGSGGLYRQEGQYTYGFGRIPVVALMRDYLTTIKGLLNGETLNYEGKTVTLHGVRLGIKPSFAVPVYLGALGPMMLRLGGELADGISLNWCTPEQVAWSRKLVNEGESRSGREKSSVVLSEYIRVCIDDDVEVARRAFVRALMNYALGSSVPSDTERALGYRGHFERMGFADALKSLDEMRNKGATEDSLIDAFPDELATQVGYFGPASGADAAFRSLAQGLDVAIVRVVAARPGLDSVRDVMQACKPGL